MSPSLAKIHLRKCLWSTSDVIRKWQSKTVDPRRSERSPSSTSSLAGTSLSSLSKVVNNTTSSSSKSSTGPTLCDVCATVQPSKNFSELLCGHSYCQSCWELHFEYQILQGLSTSKCEIKSSLSLLQIMPQSCMLGDDYCYFSNCHLAKKFSSAQQEPPPSEATFSYSALAETRLLCLNPVWYSLRSNVTSFETSDLNYIGCWALKVSIR